MKPAYTEKRSRLAFQDLDWDLMERWVKRAEERASEYELIFMPNPMPDEHVDAFCELWKVMNTAPREDYEEEDEVTTPELWRDIEAKAQGIDAGRTSGQEVRNQRRRVTLGVAPDAATVDDTLHGQGLLSAVRPCDVRQQGPIGGHVHGLVAATEQTE